MCVCVCVCVCVCMYVSLCNPFSVCMQFMNYCMNAGVIELVVFWLDVEHFKHFDGGAEDLKLFAHHIGQYIE